MADRHPSANATQRQRRARNKRIDYYPSPDALALIEGKRSPYGHCNNYSGILDAIIAELSELAGINKRPEIVPMTQGPMPELSDANARANDFGAVPSRPLATENKAKQSRKRVPCGARRRRDGQPCQAMSVPGKRRCKWHGGCSTGPRTPEGKARSAANLSCRIK